MISMEKGANLNLELQILKFPKMIFNIIFLNFPHRNPIFRVDPREDQYILVPNSVYFHGK